jgi:hypothetical protein
MGVVSLTLARLVGVSADAAVWEGVHAELVEYAQRVLSGLRTPIPNLSRGLDVPEATIAELLEGRSGGLDLDGLVRLFGRLELPIRLDPTPDGGVEVNFGAHDLQFR